MRTDFNPHTGRHDEAPNQVGSPADQPEVVEDAVDLSEDLFREYASVQASWSDSAVKNVELRHNVPFTEAQAQAIRDRGLAPIAIPLWHQIEEQAVAMLCANSPAFSSEGVEESDTDFAALYADIMAHLWRHSKGDSHMRQLVRNEVTEGRGVLYAWADWSTGDDPEIRLTTLDPIEVHPDPNSREKDWSDAAHIIVSRRLSQEQLLRLYPSREAEIRAARSGDVASSYSYTGQAYGTRSRDQGQVIGYGDQQGYSSHDHYLLLERYSAVLVDHVEVSEPAPDGYPKARRTLVLPNDPDHNVVGPRTYESYLQEPTFVIEMATGEVRYVTNDKEVAFYADLYAQYADDLSAMGEGALVPLREQPMPTPDGMAAEPRVTLARLYRRTKGDFVAAGIIEAKAKTLKRVQITCSVGGVALYQYVLPSGQYPIFPFHTQHDRNPYPTSLATKCRPIIEHYNKKQQGIIAKISAAMGNTWWTQQGTLEASGGKEAAENELLNPAPKILEYVGDQPPVQAQPVPLPAELFANQDRLKRDLYDITGYYPSAQGSQGERPDRETWRGTLHHDEAAHRRVRQAINDLHDVLNDAGRFVADMIPFVYTKERIVTIFEPDQGKMRRRRINRVLYDTYGRAIDIVDDAAAVKQDIYVLSGSTLPTSRHARFMGTLEIYQIMASAAGPQAASVLIPDLLRLSETKDWEEKAEQFLQQMDLSARLQQAQEEIKNLRGDLQTREREVYHAKMGERLAKSEHSAVRAEERVKKAAELYSQRAQDKLSDVDQLVAIIDELFPADEQQDSNQMQQAAA